MASTKTKNTGFAVGIDLGTTYSVVGCFRNNGVEILENDAGNRTTPSVVCFQPYETLVGEAAQKGAAMNPKNTIFAAKRFIGRRFDDPVVQNDIKLMPFDVVCAEGRNDPVFRLPDEVLTEGKSSDVEPVLVSSFVLKNLKSVAEKKLGGTVDRAVITVPAYFNDEQRNETKLAGELAGLEVLSVLNEPTAAAIAYGLSKVDDSTGETSVKGNILVFDLGGGTFDITVLEVMNGVFKVLSTEGDTHLGGEDFDNELRNYAVREVGRKYKIAKLQDHLNDNPRALRRLQTACEQAKRMLSTSTTAKITVENLLTFEGRDIPIDADVGVTRAKFEFLCGHLFKRIEETIRRALREADREPSQIEHVVVVGGSSRMPKVLEILNNVFPGKTLKHDVNPDEAIGYGAALQAGILSGSVKASDNTAAKGIALVDVTPLSLSVLVSGGLVQRIINRNTAIPKTNSMTFTTTEDGQSRVEVVIYEGERLEAKHNNKLGTVLLDGIPPAPKGIPQIEVTFKVDVNSIMSVEVTDLGTHKKIKKTIQREGGRIEDQVLQKMLAEAEVYRYEDELNERKHAAKQRYEAYEATVRNAIEGHTQTLTDREEKKLSALDRGKRQYAFRVVEALDQSTEYLETQFEVDSVDEIEESLKAFEKEITGIMALFYSDQRDIEDDVIKKEMDERMDECEQAYVTFEQMKPRGLGGKQ